LERVRRRRQLIRSSSTGKAGRAELTGSTMTITSLGAMGGVATTPIINAPEVAIIGVNNMVERFATGDPVPCRRLPRPFSLDDGAPGIGNCGRPGDRTKPA
jgi:hypothetical protein